jgi:hypothetical protein
MRADGNDAAKRPQRMLAASDDLSDLVKRPQVG